MSEIFEAVAILAAALGVKKINQLPGCWEHQVDARWWIAVNGHAKPTNCSRTSGPIDPYTCYIEFDGWPAGLVSPYGGALAAGEAANEEALIVALNAAVEEAFAAARSPRSPPCWSC